MADRTQSNVTVIPFKSSLKPGRSTRARRIRDEDVVELTRWAGPPTKKDPRTGKWMDERQEQRDERGPEVTVGIVRGRLKGANISDLHRFVC